MKTYGEKKKKVETYINMKLKKKYNNRTSPVSDQCDTASLSVG